MRDVYPLPGSAVYVWFDGEGLSFGIPPLDPGGRGQTLRIPIDRLSVECNDWGKPLARQTGWAVLLDVLKARHAAVMRGEPRRGTPSHERGMTIGTPSAPVQYDLDAIMRKMTRWDDRGQRAEVDAEEIGL